MSHSNQQRQLQDRRQRGRRIDSPRVEALVAPAANSSLWQQSLVFFIVTAVVLFLVAPVARAQEESEARPAASLAMVDARQDSRIVINQASSTPPEVSISLNGKAAENVVVRRATDTDVGVSTIIVIDTSVLGDPAFEGFKEVAAELVRTKGSRERIALISTGSAVNVRAPLTTNQTKLLTRIDGLDAKGNLFLWDGIDEAAKILGSTPRGSIRNVVVLAATKDLSSFTQAGAARGEMLSISGTGYVVGVERDGLDVGALRRFASESKGAITLVANPETVAKDTTEALLDQVHGTWVVDFESSEAAVGGALAVTVDGKTIDANFIRGSVTAGPALAPLPIAESNRFALITGGTAQLLGILLGGLSIAVGTYAIFLLFQRRESSLGSLLLPYEEGGAIEDDLDESGFASNALVTKAVDMTGDFAEKRGLLDKASAKLEKANIALRPAEAMTMYFAAIAFGLVLGVLSGKGIIGIIGGGFLGAIVPVVVLNYLGTRRRKKFVSQLPDMLQLLAGTLKAGYSFMQGIEAVSHEAESPMGDELRIVVTEAQLGKPVEEAMQAAADRMESPDFAWAVMAVNIQREVGGNLAELLLTVAETMTARDRLRREVLALTAEGRVSALVLGAMPILLGLTMYVLNPEYIGVLFTESVGKILLAVASTAIVIGFLWMKKTIEIKI